MPRDHVVKVYRYDELSGKAKERARNDFINSGFSFDSHDQELLSETFKEILVEKGFNKGVEVFWSLGSSQGDGVAFAGSIDIPKYMKASGLNVKFGSLIGHVEAVVNHSSRYTHKNSMTVEVYGAETGDRPGPKDWHPGTPTPDKISDFEEYLKADVTDISRELEKIGYADIEYRQSEEYIKDIFEANEYEFTVDGKFFRA
jgi:hypothetical protein